jgi:quercetin 2,3-dioxygenase
MFKQQKSNMAVKAIKAVFQGKPQRVGDGFIGRSLIPHNSFHDFSPFMMLDHHGPMQVVPSAIPKGVDAHPHRGIETITIVYEGALQHRDSAGNKGTLFPGDIQWMTAASGLVHEEKHEIEFSKKGGILHFVQLWTNLPRAYKMTPPRYQEIAASNIPNYQITEGVTMRLIAGETMGFKGVAETYNPVFLADVIVSQNADFTLQLPENQNLAIYPTEGSLTLNNDKTIAINEIALLKKEATDVLISVAENARFLILGGENINEPIVSYGPFVMNKPEEIQQAIQDYQTGKMGFLD